MTVEIVDISRPMVASGGTIYVQGLGERKENLVTFNLTIENTGSESILLRVVTKVAGIERNRSDQFEVGSGQRLQKFIHFQMLREPGDIGFSRFVGTGSPLTVCLKDSEERILDRKSPSIDWITRPVEAAIDLDLRLYRLMVYTRSVEDTLRATVNIENTGTHSWENNVSVTVQYFKGRGGRLSPFDGVSGETRALRPALGPGESIELEYQLDTTLPHGWYTVKAFLGSDQDGKQDNNTLWKEFYVYRW